MSRRNTNSLTENFNFKKIIGCWAKMFWLLKKKRVLKRMQHVGQKFPTPIKFEFVTPVLIERPHWSEWQRIPSLLHYYNLIQRSEPSGTKYIMLLLNCFGACML